MGQALAVRFKPEALRSLAFGSIGAGYSAIGTALSNPVRVFLLQNLTDETLMFSFGGATDHVVLSAGGYLLIDVTANKSLSHGFYIAQGEQVYVKQVGAPSSGSVYLSVFYGDDGN
jgi:hypothetical protein